jgi:hypothetical protein
MFERRAANWRARAVGFGRAGSNMVFYEHWGLMLAGLLCGVICLVAVIPAAIPGGTIPYARCWR